MAYEYLTLFSTFPLHALVLHTRLSPGTSLDASLVSFADDFLAANTGKQPDWVVTSPPYKGALEFVKAALTVAKVGVALKLPLSFLEPCADRGGWLQLNPSMFAFFYGEQSTHVLTM